MNYICLILAVLSPISLYLGIIEYNLLALSIALPIAFISDIFEINKSKKERYGKL